MPKLNEGEFSEFPGVTVISSVGTDYFWNRLYNYLMCDERIVNHYALLPYQSYHMTTHNLYTKEDIQRDYNWDRFIDENIQFFEIFNVLVKKADIQLKVSIIPSVVTEGVIQLLVAISEQEAQKIRALAGIYNLHKALPEAFHITLAYQYKELDQQSRLEIANGLLDYIRLELPENSISLQAPTLVYFNNMKKFIPWDGTYNPFRTDLNYYDELNGEYHIINEATTLYLVQNNDKTYSIKPLHLSTATPNGVYFPINTEQLIKSQKDNQLIFPNKVLSNDALSLEEVKAYVCLYTKESIVNPNDQLLNYWASPKNMQTFFQHYSEPKEGIGAESSNGMVLV